jgi:hypothetical protein
MADLNQSIVNAAFVDAFLHQHCFPFQLLEWPRVIDQHDEDNVAVRCLPTDAIQREEVIASQSDGGGSFKDNLRSNVEVSLILM